MRKLFPILFLTAFSLFGLESASASTLTCLGQTPAFTAGGSVFGRVVSQWNSYFGVKADHDNGSLCHTTIFDPTILLTNGPFEGNLCITTQGKLYHCDQTGVVSVVSYGADPTGVEDSSAALSAANAACVTNGGGKIFYPYGSYKISTSLSTITTSNCRIVGEPGTQIVLTGTATIDVFKFVGPGIGTPLTLTGGALAHTNTFQVSDVSALVPGNYIYFAADAPQDNPDTRYWFVSTIRSISGTTVTIDNDFPRTYSNSDTNLVVAPISLLENVGVEGPFILDATQHTTGEVHGIVQQNVTHSRFAHVRGKQMRPGWLIMTGENASVGTAAGYANTYVDLSADDSGDHNYDALYFLGDTASNYSDLASRGGIGGGWGIQWRGTPYSVVNNVQSLCQGSASQVGRNIKLAAVLYSSFTNLIANCSADNGLAISWGSNHNKFFGVVANGNFALEGLWFDSSGDHYNQVFGLSARGNSTRDIYIDAADTHNQIFGADVGTIVSFGDATNEIYGIDETASIYNAGGARINRSSDTTPQPNILINPSFDYSQFNGNNIVTLTDGVPAYLVDGWQGLFHSSGGASIGCQQTGSGFGDRALTCTVTGGSGTNNTDYLVIRQPIEAQDLAQTGLGTASPKMLCLSYTVQTSIPNVAVASSLTNYAGTRSGTTYAQVIPTANTPTPVHTCFPADTSGTWVTSGEAGGAYVYLAAAAGTSVAGNGSPNSIWNNGTLYGGTGSNTILLGTPGATVTWRDVKLEVSAGPTAYRHPDPSTEIRRVQRRFEKSYDPDVIPGTATYDGVKAQSLFTPTADTTSGTYYFPVTFNTPKRCKVSSSNIYTYSPASGAGGSGTSGEVYHNSPALDVALNSTNNSGRNGYYFSVILTRGTNDLIQFHWVADCRL